MHAIPFAVQLVISFDLSVLVVYIRECVSAKTNKTHIIIHFSFSTSPYVQLQAIASATPNAPRTIVGTVTRLYHVVTCRWGDEEGPQIVVRPIIIVICKRKTDAANRRHNTIIVVMMMMMMMRSGGRCSCAYIV